VNQNIKSISATTEIYKYTSKSAKIPFTIPAVQRHFLITRSTQSTLEHDCSPMKSEIEVETVHKLVA